MALTPEQKQKIFDLLAIGKTSAQTAKEVGCSRQTVQRFKAMAKQGDSPLKLAASLAHTKRIMEEGDRVVGVLGVLQEREPQIQNNLWLMFDGLSKLFQQVLSQTDPADISPRLLPGLAKSAADVAIAYADYADRINGLEVVAHEIQKLAETRTKEAFTASD